MKKNISPILLAIFIDSCSTETSAQLNTGTVKECLEGLTTKLFLGHANQRFDSIDDFKDIIVWKALIETKEIVPLYNVYEVASDNTDANKYETGNFVYTTKKEIKKMTSESYLSLCSHRALKSFENSDYTLVYEVTEQGEILGVWDTDGVRVKGQDISNFDVSIRERPTNDKPAFSMTTITYRDFEELEDYGVIIKPSWDPNTLNGIFSLEIEIVSASTTELVFKVLSSCGSNYYNDLLEADLLVNDAAGDPITTTGLINASNVYTLSSAAFVTGTLQTTDVIDKGEVSVEAVPVPFVVI